jgi:hypothetical protein
MRPGVQLRRRETLSHVREYHNTSRAVRHTSKREDCESNTTPASPFGGSATRTPGAVPLSDDVSSFAARGVGRMSLPCPCGFSVVYRCQKRVNLSDRLLL